MESNFENGKGKEEIVEEVKLVDFEPEERHNP